MNNVIVNFWIGPKSHTGGTKDLGIGDTALITSPHFFASRRSQRDCTTIGTSTNQECVVTVHRTFRSVLSWTHDNTPKKLLGVQHHEEWVRPKLQFLLLQGAGGISSTVKTSQRGECFACCFVGAIDRLVVAKNQQEADPGERWFAIWKLPQDSKMMVFFLIFKILDSKAPP